MKNYIIKHNNDLFDGFDGFFSVDLESYLFIYNDTLAVLVSNSRDLRVLFGNARCRVDHEDRDIAALHR